MVFAKIPCVFALFLSAAGSYFMPVVASAVTPFETTVELKTAVDQYCEGTFNSTSIYGWVMIFVKPSRSLCQWSSWVGGRFWSSGLQWYEACDMLRKNEESLDAHEHIIGETVGQSDSRTYFSSTSWSELTEVQATKWNMIPYMSIFVVCIDVNYPPLFFIHYALTNMHHLLRSSLFLTITMSATTMAFVVSSYY